MSTIRYIDLFAGAGGLSEGFYKQGFKPVAHVEYDKAACFTLKTRIAYYYLKASDKEETYYSYLSGKLPRKELYNAIPKELLDTVINAEIGKNNPEIFNQIDSILGTEKADT